MESVVFDLDGTLITCENKHKYVLFMIMNSMGAKDVEVLDRWWEFKRNGYNTMDALIKCRVSDAESITARWVAMIEDFSCSFLDRPFADALLSIKYLNSEMNFKILILTGRRDKSLAKQLILRSGFDNYIYDLIIVNPFNAVVEKAEFLKRLKPVMFIGDSETDFAAANRSDIEFTALSRGQRSVSFLEKLGIPRIENDLSFISGTNFFQK